MFAQDFKFLYLLFQYIQIYLFMKEEENSTEFMKYPPAAKQVRNEAITWKSPQDFKKIKRQQVQAEFKALSNVFLMGDLFYEGSEKMDRYTNIQTYKHSRVRIEGNPDFYLNANKVKSIVDEKEFAIFGQAPLAPFDSFWQAVYYNNVHTILMLCSFVDPTRGKQAERYWPETDEKAKFSAGKLLVINENTKNLYEELTYRVFIMEGPQGKKQIHHYHWTGWTDLKKPCEQKMNEFQFLLELCMKLISENSLLFIHCSAGIGRSGTLGGIIEGLRLLKEKNQMSIFGIVQNMRRYRYHAVQTFEQYLFLYRYLRSKV